jgi:hypothetical protein
MVELIPDADGYYHIQRHRFRLEEPDVLHMHFSGNIELEQFDQFFDTSMRLIPDRPIYFLRDVHEGGMLDSKTRSRIIKTVDPRRIAAIVSYGGSFQLKVIVTMLIKALRIFKHSAPDVAFVDTETQARTWIDTHRANRARIETQ